MTDAPNIDDHATPVVKKPAIGFPAPLLGNENLRMDVLYNAGNLLAIDRPANILCGPHPWYDLPVISEALNVQLEMKKPELLRLGLDPCKRAEAVFHVDPGIAGISILAIGPEAVAKARNAFGSYQWTMTFVFVAIGGPGSDEAQCDLPVARHNNLPMALVSTKTGRKTSTKFHRIEKIGGFSIWEAVTTYYRADQLPVHATELGIRIVGENVYAHEKPVRLSEIKRKWDGDRETEKPLYDAPAAYLAKVRIENGDEIVADMPKRLDNMIRQMRRYSAGGRCQSRPPV
jgi:23S rRNA-/tRNA-specific pseudouridylate synthase